MYVTHIRSLGCWWHPDLVPDNPSVPVGTLLGPDRETEQREKGLDEVVGEGDPRKNEETPRETPTLNVGPTFGPSGDWTGGTRSVSPTTLQLQQAPYWVRIGSRSDEQKGSTKWQ